MKTPIGPLLQSYLVDHLGAVHGLRLSSIRSYRDALRLFLVFAARDTRRGIGRLAMGNLTFERVQRFPAAQFLRLPRDADARDDQGARWLTPDAPLFASGKGGSLTRFGIYKLVSKHGQRLEARPKPRSKRVTPHVFRHTAAVHLLEAGVEVNAIRGWLGHVSLATTNRYAEITTPMKEAALGACQPPVKSPVGPPKKPVWRGDKALLTWLESL